MGSNSGHRRGVVLSRPSGKGTPMEIRIDGDGPSLVLIHSLLTDAAAFDDVIPALSKQRRVVRLSLPGYGGSPPLSAERPTMADLADAIAAGMDQAEVEPSGAVLGNGLGAFVALALAVDHGHRFGPLIVANGGATFAEDRRLAFTKMADLVDDGGMAAVADLAIHRIYPADYLQANPAAAEERRAVLIKANPVAFAAACRALRDLDLTPNLPRLTNPTLVVAGEADQTTPPEMARQLAAELPNSELVELADCGHCPPLEQPEAFANAVSAFLDAQSETS